MLRIFRVLRRAERLEVRLLRQILQYLERMRRDMSDQLSDLNTAVNRIGDDVSRIAADVQAVADKLSNLPVPPDVKSMVQPSVDALGKAADGLEVAAGSLEQAISGTTPPPTPGTHRRG